jgi:hypothetical protein
MVQDLVLRFVIGGVFVSLFALSGDVVRPRSFGGIFSAAPSVALATLALTIIRDGRGFAVLESRSMIAGAIAFLLYSVCAKIIMMRWEISALGASTLLLAVWTICALGIWLAWLR